MVDSLNNLSLYQGQLPLLYSIDAAPILFNVRLQGSSPLMNTVDIKT